MSMSFGDNYKEAFNDLGPLVGEENIDFNNYNLRDSEKTQIDLLMQMIQEVNAEPNAFSMSVSLESPIAGAILIKAEDKDNNLTSEISYRLKSEMVSYQLCDLTGEKFNEEKALLDGYVKQGRIYYKLHSFFEMVSVRGTVGRYDMTMENEEDYAVGLRMLAENMFGGDLIVNSLAHDLVMQRYVPLGVSRFVRGQPSAV